MDAVKFVEECRRMFAFPGGMKYSLFNMSICAEDVVKEVEELSAAHPRKTRQSVFLEQFPEAKCSKAGVLTICPTALYSVYRSSDVGCTSSKRKCEDYLREFWMQEVE